MGDLGSIPGVGKIPWRRKWQPTPVSLPGEFHGQRSLVGYSRGIAELDTTERLHSLTHYLMSFPGGASSKEPACQFRRYKRQVLSLGWEPLKKGTATHSNILVWRIPWTEEPGRVTQSRTQFKWFSIPACIVQFTLKYFWQDTRINRWRERKEK